VPFPELLATLGVAAEIVGPIALVLGVFPRLTALLLIAFTVVATVISHSFWMFPAEAQAAQQTQFFKNVAIIGGLLFYFVSGPGAYSVPERFLQRWGIFKGLDSQTARSRA
jgi:putative oxidoreductase